MITNMYEVFDAFEEAPDKKKFLRDNATKFLQQVLFLTFDDRFQYYITELPEEFNPQDSLPGIRYTGLNNEIRKLYLFQKGNSVADKLTEKKRMDLFLQLAETIELREVEVLMGIMRKDLCVKGLDKELVKEVFPTLLGSNPSMLGL